MIEVGRTVGVGVDRNQSPRLDDVVHPQSWVDNIFEATEADFVPAMHRVFRSDEFPSGLEVGVLAQEE